MPIFPSNPNNNDEHTLGSRKFKFDSTKGLWKLFDASSAAVTGGSSTTLATAIDHKTYTATDGQTTFAVAYSGDDVIVSRNGIKLTPDEYTASNGTSVILSVGCNADDAVDCVGFTTAEAGGASVTVSDTAPTGPSEGDMWFNSTLVKTYVYYGSTWVVLNPSGTSSSGSSVTTYATIAELPLSGNDAGDQALVSENNRLYIWNGDGWYNIALINTAPSITTGSASTYTLAKDGTPTVITLEATDPEGLPITWSYSVTSGSLGSTATVSQADNVFTITPSTNEADAGTFELTFTASDGVNIATTTSTVQLVFFVPPNYALLAHGYTGLQAATAYEIDGVTTSYTGGGSVYGQYLNTISDINENHYLLYQHLPAGGGISLGPVDFTTATSKDFTWQFFIKTTRSGSYHNVFNDGVNAFNSHTFKYADHGGWYWYNGTGYDTPTGTQHQGADTWYHMIVQGDYSTGTIHTWINTSYIGSNVVGQAFWDTDNLADFSNMTINTTSAESYDMYIGEMKIWKGHQQYTVGQDTTWSYVFGEV